MNSVVDYVIEDGIGIVTIDYPPVNALSHAVRQGIQNAIRAAQDDDSEAVLLWCNGRLVQPAPGHKQREELAREQVQQRQAGG